MRHPAALVLVLSLALGCTAEQSGLFQTGASGGAGAQTGGSAGIGGSIGGTAGVVGTSGAAGAGGASGAAGASGSAGDGGSSGSAGTAGGAGHAGSAGSGGEPLEGAGIVACGDDECLLDGGEICCDRGGEGMGCVPPVGTCRCEGFLCRTTTITCDGAEDCPGQVCCAEHEVTGNLEQISCVQECVSGIVGSKNTICNPDTPKPCRDGRTCVPANNLPGGFFVCD